MKLDPRLKGVIAVLVILIAVIEVSRASPPGQRITESIQRRLKDKPRGLSF